MSICFRKIVPPALRRPQEAAQLIFSFFFFGSDQDELA